MSSGSIRRLSGSASATSASNPKPASIGVFAGPGLITFTRTSGASSIASARASPITPAFDATYARQARAGRGWR